MALVLVTGATGRIGQLVIDELLGADVPVRAIAREPATAGLPARAEVFPGDLTEPDSLDAALQGVSAAFLLWTAPFATAPAVIERLATNVERVVYLSAPFRTPHPFFQQPNPMATLHAAVEQLLADSGVVATIIRPGMFASNALHWWAPAIRAGDSIRWPYGSAETAPTDERDVAAVAAHALREEGHTGADYVITGPESLSQREQVRLIGEAIRRPVAFRELSPDEFRAETAATWPRPVLDMLLAAWGATMGRPAFVTSTISDVLGRPPRTFREWAEENVAAFLPARASDDGPRGARG